MKRKQALMAGMILLKGYWVLNIQTILVKCKGKEDYFVKYGRAITISKRHSFKTSTIYPFLHLQNFY